MDKKLLSLVSLFFLSFAIFAGVVIFNKPLTQITRAKEDILPSGETSLMLGWPLNVKADGKESSTITVFVRTSTGKPVPNKSVIVKSSIGNLQPENQKTNEEGKTQFTLTSTAPGIAEVSATVETIPLSQNLSIKFE